MTTVLEDLDLLGNDVVLQVEEWTDPLLERLGHDSLSAYVERFWLPVLGPSTLLLVRHLARGLQDAPAGFACDLAETAQSLGLGDRRGRNAPFSRTLARAVDFDAARFARGRLLVRRYLPPLARRHVSRLPPTLRAEHERALRAATRRSSCEHDEPLQRRGRQLALSLLQLGEEPDAVMGHLRQWRFPVDLADSCLAWATTQRALQGRQETLTPQRGAWPLVGARPERAALTAGQP